MNKYIYAFMAGYSINACIWRIDTGKYDDIIFPVVISVLGFLALIIESRRNKTIK